MLARLAEHRAIQAAASSLHCTFPALTALRHDQRTPSQADSRRRELRKLELEIARGQLFTIGEQLERDDRPSVVFRLPSPDRSSRLELRLVDSMYRF